MTRTISSRAGLSSQSNKSLDLTSTAHQNQKLNKNTSGTVGESTEQAPTSELQITHVTTGRIRIRATDGSHHSMLETICQYLQQQDGVRDVSVNQQTGSLVVYFDEEELSLPEVLALLEQYGIQQQQASPQGATKTDPFAAWKSIHFWTEQGISFIPLFAGLAVTGRLGIHGLRAIPIYLITANVTRQIINTLGSELSAHKQKSNKGDKTHKIPVSEVEQASTINQNSSVGKESQTLNYNVVHSIPGRIRFNVPQLARDRAYARRLERLLKTDPQVTNVRVNHNTASVAITYKSKHIPVEHWVRLVQLALETHPQTIAIQTPTEQLQPKVENQDQSWDIKELVVPHQENTTEATGFWVDYKPPALSTALAFMANFPLNPAPPD